MDVFNGYRLCFYLHRQATPRERIISTVRIFSEKGKASLSQPAEARSCPLCFRSSKTSSTPHKRIGPQENLSNSFPSLPHLTGMSCRFLSRHLHFSQFHAVGGTFLVSVLSNHLHAGNWAAPEGGFFWEALTRKIPATSAGTKLQNKENLRCANCSPQVWWTQRDSNPRPLGCEPNALPAELWAQKGRLAYQAAFIF